MTEEPLCRFSTEFKISGDLNYESHGSWGPRSVWCSQPKLVVAAARPLLSTSMSSMSTLSSSMSSSLPLWLFGDATKLVRFYYFYFWHLCCHNWALVRHSFAPPKRPSLFLSGEPVTIQVQYFQAFTKRKVFFKKFLAAAAEVSFYCLHRCHFWWRILSFRRFLLISLLNKRYHFNGIRGKSRRLFFCSLSSAQL